MTFHITDENGKVVGAPAMAEDFAFEFCRRHTAVTGRPLFVRRFVHNDAGELVPVGAPVEVGVAAEEESSP